VQHHVITSSRKRKISIEEMDEKKHTNMALNRNANSRRNKGFSKVSFFE